MLHHVSFAVNDLVRARVFYDALLGPLGYVCVESTPTFVGYGLPGGGDKFALKARPQRASAPSDGFHLAFAAPSRGAVLAAYEAGIDNGGLDNGPPGLRPSYGPHYYAGFLVDPDGYHVEIVINTPASSTSA